VTCNAVSPGYVWTELLSKQVANQAKALGIEEEDVVERVFLRDQPIKRFILAEEVGAAVKFLAGEGSGGITGVNLCVHGRCLTRKMRVLPSDSFDSFDSLGLLRLSRLTRALFVRRAAGGWTAR